MLRETDLAATDAARLDHIETAHPAIPGPSEIRAAWLRLPMEARDRIGTLAVDHMFQMFLAYGHFAPEQQGSAADVKACGDALVRADDTLEELRVLTEELVPELFGTPGEDPAWTRRPAR